MGPLRDLLTGPSANETTRVTAEIDPGEIALSRPDIFSLIVEERERTGVIRISKPPIADVR